MRIAKSNNVVCNRKKLILYVFLITLSLARRNNDHQSNAGSNSERRQCSESEGDFFHIIAERQAQPP